jgi:hypothetical protein
MLNALSDYTREKRNTESKIRTVFLLGPTERAALEQLSVNTGARLSELLRRATLFYLNRQREKNGKRSHGRE